MARNLDFFFFFRKLFEILLFGDTHMHTRARARMHTHTHNFKADQYMFWSKTVPELDMSYLELRVFKYSKKSLQIIYVFIIPTRPASGCDLKIRRLFLGILLN